MRMQGVAGPSGSVIRGWPLRSTRASRRSLTADPLHHAAARIELVFQPFEAAVEMIDPIHYGLALGCQSRDHERHRGAEIGRHYRCAAQAIHALDGGLLTVQRNSRAEPCQL